MTRIGYARVSTAEQSLDPQHDALAAAGCSRVFSDVASGRLAARPELNRALDYARPGDELVVTRLDRLGRSVRHLVELAADLDARGIALVVSEQGIDTGSPAGRMVFHVFAALAEFEAELIAERTRDGLAAARARGRAGGRPAVMTPGKLDVARRLAAEGHSAARIAATIGVGRTTVRRHLGSV